MDQPPRRVGAPVRPVRARESPCRCLATTSRRGSCRRQHGGTWWEQTTLRQRRRDASGSIGSSRRPTPRRSDSAIPLALTIHDVSFLAHPEWFRPRERLRRRWLTQHSARSAAVGPDRFRLLARRDREAHRPRRRAGAGHPAGRQRRGTPGWQRRRRARAAGAVRRDAAEPPAGSPARRRVRGRQPPISRTRAWPSSAPIAPGRPRTSAPSRRGSASRAKSMFAATSATQSWRRSTHAPRCSSSFPSTKASA